MTSKIPSKIELTRKEQKCIKEEVLLINKLQQIDIADDLILESLKRIEIIIKGKNNGRTLE